MVEKTCDYRLLGNHVLYVENAYFNKFEFYIGGYSHIPLID